MNTNTTAEQPAGKLLTPREASAVLGLSTHHLANLRCSGRGPAFFKVGDRYVRYDENDLNVWMRSRRFTSTSQEAMA